MAPRRGGDRQSAEALILSSPAEVPGLGLRTFVWTLAILLGLAASAYVALNVLLDSGWLSHSLFGIAAAAMLLSSHRIYKKVSPWRERRWFERTWQKSVLMVDSLGRRTRADEAEAGMWICLERGYKEAKRRTGERGSTMAAEYRSLVATIRINGNEQLLSFSDGSVERCSPRSPIFVAGTQDRELSFVRDQRTVDSSASALSRMMQKLDAQTDGRLSMRKSLRTLATFYGSDATLEALRAAEWWSFIKTDEWGQWLEITDAGRTWAEADPSRLINLEKVNKMKDRRRTEPSFSIGSNYGVINVARTIRGDSIVSTSGISDRDLLTALRDVLTLKEIPWESAELADVRKEVETAIAEKDAHRAGLKTAIPKLFRVCRDLAIGVSSSAIFEVLKGYLS